MKSKSILILIAAVALAACGGKSAKTSADGQQSAQLQTQSTEDAFTSECQKTLQQVDGLQRKLADPQQYTSQQGVEDLQRAVMQRTYSYQRQPHYLYWLSERARTLQQLRLARGRQRCA